MPNNIETLPGASIPSIRNEFSDLLHLDGNHIVNQVAYRWLRHGIREAKIFEMFISQNPHVLPEGIQYQDLLEGVKYHDIAKPELTRIHGRDFWSIPGDLTDEEWKIMQLHPVIGAAMLNQYYEENPNRMSRIIISMTLNHHEHYDGLGYPNRKKGTQIPWEARLLTIVDNFTAGIESRPYSGREKIPLVMAYLNEHANFFDPNYLRVFIDFVKSGALADMPWIKQ